MYCAFNPAYLVKMTDYTNYILVAGFCVIYLGAYALKRAYTT